MKRTHATPVLALAAAGVAAGFLLELAFARGGRAILVPPVSLPITLVIAAAAVVVLAIPIKRATSGRSQRPVNPFSALRTAVLAKACSLAGALLTGGTGGVLVYLLTRQVLPAPGAIGLSITAIVGSAVLLAGGLVAEFLCTLPPPEQPDREHPRPEHP